MRDQAQLRSCAAPLEQRRGRWAGPAELSCLRLVVVVIEAIEQDDAGLSP